MFLHISWSPYFRFKCHAEEGWTTNFLLSQDFIANINECDVFCGLIGRLSSMVTLKLDDNCLMELPFSIGGFVHGPLSILLANVYWNWGISSNKEWHFLLHFSIGSKLSVFEFCVYVCACLLQVLITLAICCHQASVSTMSVLP